MMPCIRHFLNFLKFDQNSITEGTKKQVVIFHWKNRSKIAFLVNYNILNNKHVSAFFERKKTFGFSSFSTQPNFLKRFLTKLLVTGQSLSEINTDFSIIIFDTNLCGP